MSGNAAESSSTDRADYDVFISYSRKDKAFVQQLHSHLVDAGYDVWVDWEDIPPTAEWRQEIYLGIQAANNFIFVISSNSLASKVCVEELEHALEHRKRLIPIVWQDVGYESPHPELSKLNYIFFRPSDDFESAFQTLVSAIATDLNHVRTHTRLLVRAKEWQSREYDSSLLLQGSYLEDAERWLTASVDKNPQPAELHHEFIRVSRQVETERQNAELRLHRLTPQQYRNRQALLSKVNHYWIKGVLERSLHDRAMLELGLEERPGAIDHPWNAVLETSNHAQKALPTGTKVIDVFDQLGEGRTLLILGEPGSGKTTTLLELTRDLVTRAEADIDYPIPVVFSLSSWRGEKQAIADWLVEELNAKYQVPKKIGQAWVERQQLLLLLDGLDEVELKHRDACIVALNAFNQKHGAEMVVCSRIKDYEALSNRLNFQNAIFLRSLTSEQLHQYLNESDAELSALKTMIHEDSTLHELARSPLMLSIMILAYRGVSLAEMPKSDEVEDRRKQLFDTYLDRMFKRRSADQLYTQAKTVRWLSWLAQRMSQLSQTVLLIENIQPTWLQTPTQQRIYRIGVKLLLAAIWGGLHVGLLAGHSNNMVPFNTVRSLEGLAYGLIGALVYGIVGGLLGGLVTETTNHLTGRLINGLLLGAIYAPIFTWVYNWKGGLAYGLIYFLIGVFIYGPLHEIGGIVPTDSLRWSWRKARNHSIYGLGLTLALNFGVTVDFIPSLIFGLMLAFILGFDKSNEVDRRTIPNQRIWKSVTNAGKLFVLVGLPTGLLLGFLEGLTSGLVNGLLLGVGSALIGGGGAGITCIKHFVLRRILWWNDYTPWNYARFLDYAADRIFLQKVGGGYVFVHRLLLEHFAQLK